MNGFKKPKAILIEARHLLVETAIIRRVLVAWAATMLFI